MLQSAPQRILLLVLCLGLLALGALYFPGATHFPRSDDAPTPDPPTAWRPDLDPAELHLFLHGSDAEFNAYLDSLGYLGAGGVWPHISPDMTSYEAFCRSWPDAHQLRLRLSIGFDSVWGDSAIRRAQENKTGLSNADAWTVLSLDPEIARVRLIRDSEARLTRLRELEAGYRGVSPVLIQPGIYELRAEVYGRRFQMSENQEDIEQAVEWCRRAVLQAETSGTLHHLCSLLSKLGIYQGAAGYPDSLDITWRRFWDIGRKHDLPYEMGRYLEFAANRWFRRGENALALQFMRSAQEPCREVGDQLEIRFLLSQSGFHARLGCWDLFARETERMTVLRERLASITKSIEGFYSDEVDWKRARLEMATGNADTGHAMFQDLRQKFRFRGKFDQIWGVLAVDWASGLIAHNRPAEAIRVTLGVQADYVGKPLDQAPHHANLAQAYHALGLPDSSASHIEKFRASALRAPSYAPQWDRMFALSARLHADRGETRAALDTLRAGLQDLEIWLATMDASAWSYLVVEGCRAQRDLLHEMLADQPEAGLAVERQWREIYRHMGTGDSLQTLSSCIDIAEDALYRDRGTDRNRDRDDNGDGDGGSGGTALLSGTSPEDVEILYYVTPESVLRWTLHDGAVRRDLIANPTQLETSIRSAALELGRDPGTAQELSPSLRQSLARIAEQTLPKEVLESAGGRIVVSPDAWLRLLPIEVFPIGKTEEYEPLVNRWDVVYRRSFANPARVAAVGPGVVVSDPQASAQTRRAFRGLPDLEHGRMEAETVAGTVEHSVVLIESEADRGALDELWRDAPFIYYVGHVVRDREYPYLPAMLLAFGGSDSPDDLLFPADIRAQEFPACELVVLSGCSSGLPYVTGRRASASPGDAFLDAGVSRVVQTVWDIKDRESSQLMSQFVQLWATEGFPPEAALAEAKRTLLRSSDHRHPFYWAAYIIQDQGAD